MLGWVVTFIAPFVPLIAAAIAAWFCRHGIIAFLEARVREGVKHEFDKKLEEFRADLREQGKIMESLRDGALADMISRQTALFSRRIEAMDQIWSDVVVYRNARHLVFMLSMDIKYTEKLLRSPDGRRLVLEPSLKAIEGKDINEYKKAEPFVSPMVWALAQAYFRTIGIFVFGAQALMKEMLPLEDVIATLKDKNIEKVLKEVLPEQASMIEEQGCRCYNDCLGMIERNIIKEFDNMLESDKADEQSVQRAARIVKLIEESQKSEQQQKMNASL